MILLLENNIRVGLDSVMSDRYIKSDDNPKILYFDVSTLCGWAMSEPLPYDKIELWRRHPSCYINESEDFLDTIDESIIGYFVKVDLRCLDEIEEKTKNFLFATENIISRQDNLIQHMKDLKPNNQKDTLWLEWLKEIFSPL